MDIMSNCIVNKLLKFQFRSESTRASYILDANIWWVCDVTDYLRVQHGDDTEVPKHGNKTQSANVCLKSVFSLENSSKFSNCMYIESLFTLSRGAYC